MHRQLPRAVPALLAPLFRLDDQGQPQLVGKPGKRKRSEHGLGHLLDPTKGFHEDQEPFRDEWWLQLITSHLGLERPAPIWFGEAAIGRLTISSRHEERTFTRHNATRPSRSTQRLPASRSACSGSS